jgi:hypothetical protein
MGPVRGGLILACLALPGPALAEVCARLRPDWDGGPVGPVAEAIALFSSLPALALLLGTALAIRLRHQGLALGVVVLWTVLVSFAALRRGLRRLALLVHRARGCDICGNDPLHLPPTPAGLTLWRPRCSKALDSLATWRSS